MVITSRHDVLEKTSTGAPNIPLTTTDLFKGAAHGHVRPEPVKNLSVRFENNLRLGRGSVGLRERKLSWHQVLSRIQQIRRWGGVHERREQMRVAFKFREQRRIARRRI